MRKPSSHLQGLPLIGLYCRLISRLTVSSHCLRSVLATESRMSPVARKRADRKTSPVASNAVGSLGTNPVSMNSLTTGTPSARPTMRNASEMSVKNLSGRYSLKSDPIIMTTLMPSDTVLSFDTLPSGLLYCRSGGFARPVG